MRKIIFLFLLILLGCSEHKDSRELTNGYKVLAMAPTEVYIANPDSELVVGPTIESIGLVGDLVVAYCGWEKSSANGFENTVGYNIVDTRNKNLLKNLSENEMREELKRLNLTMPRMESPL
jgi:hypothetical protein